MKCVEIRRISTNNCKRGLCYEPAMATTELKWIWRGASMVFLTIMSQTKRRFYPHFSSLKSNPSNKTGFCRRWGSESCPFACLLCVQLKPFFIHSSFSFVAIKIWQSFFFPFSSDLLRWNSILKWQQLNFERPKWMQSNCSFWVLKTKTCAYFHYVVTGFTPLVKWCKYFINQPSRNPHTMAARLRIIPIVHLKSTSLCELLIY